MNTRVLSTRAIRVARTASSLSGQVTARLRMEPSFLIVGTQRGGTTSLFKALAEHPGVLSPAFHKGVHYFDTEYNRGDRWYRGHFPMMLTAARTRRLTGIDAITGEASPYYMFHPAAPSRIRLALPDVRLIVLIRDPVERAYSAHTHELARGFEKEPFERALELEADRLAGEAERLLADASYQSPRYQHNAYLARGRYIEQLDRLERLFGRERIHVIDSGLLFERPGPVLAELIRFLGLPSWKRDHLPVHNARPRAQMGTELRRRLEDYFAPYDQRLIEFIGQEPSWRR